jgi:CRP/FNR family transcriptional regulator, cyclic AMP receptor protein
MAPGLREGFQRSVGMSDAAILEIFTGHGFLERLRGGVGMELAASATPFQAAAGEKIGVLGEPCRHLYLIERGRVAATRPGPHGPLVIDNVGAGQEFGWSWLLPEGCWHFDVVALEPTVGVRFSAEWLQECCERRHEVGYRVYEELAHLLAARLVAALARLTP